MCRDMKDSGVQWIGYIPKAWNITKIKMLSDIYTGTSISDDLKDRYTVKENAIPYISTKDLDISSKSIDYDNGLFIPNGEKGFRLAEKDSTLLCIEGGSAGKKVAFTDRDVNFVNKLCCIKSKDYNNKFIYYYINSSAFTEQFNLNLSGLIGGVSINLLKQIIIVVPTVYEQQKISNYLDKKVSQIDDIISKQKSLIEKYKAYKQSLITETVTKGLNKNVPMKDSGIEWIGEIPNHWDIKRLRYECSIKTGNKDTVNKVDNGAYPFYVRSPKIERIDSYSFDGEAILTAGDGVGAGKVFHYINGKFDYHQRVYNLHNFNSISGKYLYYYLKNNFYKVIEASNAKSTVDSIRLPMLLNFPVLIPYKEEQKEIAEFLDKRCNIIDSAISKKEQLIEKFEEYKKSLIYECVTGKREVM